VPKIAICNTFSHVPLSSMIAIALIATQANYCVAQSQPLPSWAPDRSCLQQFEIAGKECSTQLGAQANSMPALQQCIEGKTSQDCKSQMSNAQKYVSQAIPQCAEATQQYAQALKITCGNLTKENESCYKKVLTEHSPKMEAACKGMR
jgi:hypothetical protein